MSIILADAELQLATMDALRGTADLREKLELALSSGTPSISDLAYAIKVRVKEDYSCVKKVLSKREEGRADYDVETLRDVLGVRIVTLYRLDALSIIPLIIEMIDSSSDAGPFERGSLEEVRIYTTNPGGDAQGLSGKILRTFANSGYKGLATTEENSNNYTSIHMVAWGLGKYQDEYRRIPVEIQVRTAFEDVWGEIEHALKYKRKAVNLREGSEEALRIDASLAHLNVLKTMVDGIAQYADQIKIQLQAGDDSRIKSAFARVAEEPIIRLQPLRDLPETIKSAVQQAFALAKPALESGPTASAVEKVRELKSALQQLRVVRNDLDSLTLKPRTLREVTYVIDMQIALVLSEIGNASSDGRPFYEEAAALYVRWEEELPNRLAILYRHAKVLDALGQPVQAIEKLRTVVRRLAAKNEPTPASHWVRSAAPRVLGVILWEEALRVARLGGEGSEGALQRKIELLREAYEVTKAAYGRKVKEDPLAPSHHPSERAKAANNLLYYALELADAMGSEAEGQVPKSEEVLTFLADMEAENPSELNDPRFLDTALRAYRYLGDDQKALESGTRFLEIVTPLSGSEWPQNEINDAMVLRAREIVAEEASKAGKAAQ